jgi:hypothetical protein
MLASPGMGSTMMEWLLGALIAFVGLAHAIASWLYFARDQRELWWLWSLGWVLATVACIAAAHTSEWTGYGLFAGLVAVWTVWWVAIQASTTLDWVAENRYQATGQIVGNTLVIRHVRNFDWKGKRTFEERWEERVYDLAKLRALDLFVCFWGNPRIAHVMLSFDFADGAPICFSVETRREITERWTPLAGFMKSYELLIIAGDERDLVRNRINIRGEDVRLYRVFTTPDMRRRILEGIVGQMTRLAERPRFYNTIFHNCINEIARIVWTSGQKFPLDWRILFSGYVAEYLYDIELLDPSRPFAALKAHSDIRARSLAADQDPLYSRRIRDGLADPNTSKATVIASAV